MRGMNQAWLGVLAAILSGVIVLGSLMLSLVEGGQALALLPPLNPTPTPPLMTLPPGVPTYTPSATPSSTPTATAAIPANCSSVPAGWQAVVIQPDDDLSTIASRYGVSVQALRQANCLPANINIVKPGSFIFVPPPTPSPTPLPPTATLRPLRTTQPCGHPTGWTIYRVRPGDTLYSLSIRLGVHMQNLQAANCMGNSVKLYAGQPLWVPFLPLAPTVPPTWTPILPPPTLTATSLPPTFTASPVPPTLTPMPTSLAPTNTRPAPTNTRPAPTNTRPAPTNTGVSPTNTPVPTNTSMPPTNTPRPTATTQPPATTQPTATPRRKPTTQPPITIQAPATTQARATKQPADATVPLPVDNGPLYPLAPAGSQTLLEPPAWLRALFANRTSWITFVVMK